MTRGKLLATGATGALAAYGLTASGAAARGMLSRAVLADTVTLASYEENAGIPALAADTKLFTKATGIDVKTTHVCPWPVPGADQQLPPGASGRRLHVVRRLPDAVLRLEGTGDADRRRLEDPHTADATGLQGRLDGPRRAPVLRAEQELPMGRVLPKELVEGEGLHGPEDMGAVRRARQEDAERRADADRVHGQGRLAPDGLVRHHQHADQRLRLPRATSWRGSNRGTARR